MYRPSRKFSSKRPSGGKIRPQCVLCYNSISSPSANMNIENLHNICRQYLHSGIYDDSSKNCQSNGPSSAEYLFCPRCIQSASELAAFQIKLDLVQKNIAELAFMFSLSILHRRGKYVDHEDQKESDNYISIKKLVPFDVSTLPNCASWDNSEENTSTAFEPSFILGENYADERNEPLTSQDHYTAVENNLNAETGEMNPLWMFHNENDEGSFDNDTIEEPCSYSALQSEPVMHVSVKLENSENDLESVQHCESSFSNPLEEDSKSEFVLPPPDDALQSGSLQNILVLKKRCKRQQRLRLPVHVKPSQIGKLNVASKKSSQLQCHLCQHIFCQRSTLKRHIEVVHEQVRRYQCPICLKRFRANYDMVTHVQKVHKEDVIN